MFGRGEEYGGGINATRAREWRWRGPLDCGNVRRVSPVSLLPLPPPPPPPLPLPLEPRGGGAVLPAGPARLFTPSHYGGARLETCSFTFISIYLCLSPPRPVHLFIFLFFRFFPSLLGPSFTFLCPLLTFYLISHAFSFLPFLLIPLHSIPSSTPHSTHPIPHCFI